MDENQLKVAKAEVQCPGCDDLMRVKDLLEWDAFQAAVYEFRDRHSRCEHQGKLPGARR